MSDATEIVKRLREFTAEEVEAGRARKQLLLILNAANLMELQGARIVELEKQVERVLAIARRMIDAPTEI